MAIEPEQDQEANALIPPRPNLGPEPWPEPSSWSISPAGWGLALVLALLILALFLRRRRRSPDQTEPPTSDASEASIEDAPSTRQRWIASSDQVREALIEAFGTGWGSKTTEEIIEETRLNERLGPEEVDRLIQFLRLSDRAKFALDEPEALEDWPAWAEAFVEGLAVKRT